MMTVAYGGSSHAGAPGSSMLHDSILGFGLLFLGNLYVLNIRSYLGAMLVKLEGQGFKSYAVQALLPSEYTLILFQDFCLIQCISGLHLGSTGIIQHRSILCKRCVHWVGVIAGH